MWACSCASTSARCSALKRVSKSAGNTTCGRHKPNVAGSPARAACERHTPACGTSGVTLRRNLDCTRHIHSPHATAPSDHIATKPQRQSNHATAGAARTTIHCAGITNTCANGAGANCATGAGSTLASNAAGTNNHAAYATPTPNARRSGRRRASTMTMAALPAKVACNNPAKSSVLGIVKALDQLAQFGNVVAAQFLMLRKMRHQRRNSAIEQAIQQAATFLQHPVFALE